MTIFIQLYSGKYVDESTLIGYELQLNYDFPNLVEFSEDGYMKIK